MKIYISIDMEGISGTTTFREERARMQALMTSELLNVIDGIKKADENVEYIRVCDSHALGDNINYSELPEFVELVRGYPRPFYMMQGIDSSFDAVFLVGYHAPVGTWLGMMDHTYSSFSFYNVRINGIRVGEAEINALVAAKYGVPVTFISGDRALHDFSVKNFPDTVFVMTKEGISRYAGLLYNAKKMKDKIISGAETAVRKAKSVKPADFIKKPFTISIDFTDTLKADLACMMPGAIRTEGRTCEFKSSDIEEIYRFMISATMLGWVSKNL